METRREDMQARLYLGDISQEKIRPTTLKGAAIAEYFKPNNPAIVICCDAFCCILDCKRPVNPGDDVSNPDPTVRWAPELVLRKEKFGGLVWNRKTGHVWQISTEATKLCFDLARGKTLKQVTEKHGVSESDLFSLLAQVSQQLQ